MSRVEVPHFRPFVGHHCETVATGTLLAARGLKLSQPMLFGLGEGLGFIFTSIERSGRTAEAAPLSDAAQRCRRVADIEVAAMRLLAGI